MLICVAGKNDIAVDVLTYLNEKNIGQYILGVVCNKTETGQNTWQKSLRFFAKMKKIPEYTLEKLFDIKELIFLSLEYDKIIKPELFKSNKLYNIHFSLLPQYKGMYTSAIPILNDEKEVGVTLHKIDRGIDTGDIIEQKSFELLNSYNCRDLYLQYVKYGTELVINNLENIINEKVVMHPQTSQNSTYYSQKYIDYSNINIDLCQTALGIQKQIRAFSFREYQLPEVYNRKIIGTRITKSRSKEKAGNIIYNDLRSMILSTIDYNIIIYIDRLEELIQACKTGDLKTVIDICSIKEHINEKNQEGITPLIEATRNNQIEIVKYMISAGADIYSTNSDGKNLLMYACDAYIDFKSITLINLYLKLGLSAKNRDYYGKDLYEYLNERNYSFDLILMRENIEM